MAELFEIGQAIRAEERLEGIVDGAAGGGRLKKGAYRSHVRGLERAAGGTAKHSGPGPTDAQLTAIGIEVEHVKP